MVWNAPHGKRHTSRTGPVLVQRHSTYRWGHFAQGRTNHSLYKRYSKTNQVRVTLGLLKDRRRWSVGQATRSRRRRDVWRAAETCGARETERDRFCTSDAGAIDAAEGGPAPNKNTQLVLVGRCISRCIIWLVAFVCLSLRRLFERVESHGRHSLLCPFTYTAFLPRGGLCVRACNHRPQQHIVSTRLQFYQQ